MAIVELVKSCVVKSHKIDLVQQHQIIHRHLTHSDCPPLWVTYGCPDVNFKRPEQLYNIPIEQIHGEVLWADFDDGILTCEVEFKVHEAVAEVLKNNDVYLSALYTVIDDRVANLIRMYANIKIQYQGV